MNCISLVLWCNNNNSVIDNKLTTSTTHIDLHKGLLSRGSPFAVERQVDNIRCRCHCFQATNRNWLKIGFPQSLPRRASTEWEDYWERDWSGIGRNCAA